MRYFFSLLLLTTAVRAVVRPYKFTRLAERLQHIATRQAFGGGYTLDPCQTNKDCKPPRFCAISLCLIDMEDERQCTSCSDCPGYKDGLEVCAIYPDTGDACISSSAAADLRSPLASGCGDVTSSISGWFPDSSFSPLPELEPQGLPIVPFPEQPVPPEPSPEETMLDSATSEPLIDAEETGEPGGTNNSHAGFPSGALSPPIPLPSPLLSPVPSASPKTRPPIHHSNGYTLDTCSTNFSCRGTRLCVLGYCWASPQDQVRCISCSTCVADVEVCARDSNGVGTCVSATGFSLLKLRPVDDCEIELEESAMPSFEF